MMPVPRVTAAAPANESGSYADVPTSNPEKRRPIASAPRMPMTCAPGGPYQMNASSVTDAPGTRG
jgi:hypothetical protein